MVKIRILVAILIFGSIGILVKNIKLSSIEIAFLRAVIGSLFLIVTSFALKQKVSFKSIKENIIILLQFLLYFTSLKNLNSQSIAVLSYIDPISAVIMAAVFLGESMTIFQIIGGILILGSTFLSERFAKK